MSILSALLLTAALVDPGERPLVAEPAPPDPTALLQRDGVPDIPQRIERDTEPYRRPVNIRFSGWLPGDAGLLVSGRFEGTTQLHRVRKPGARPRPVTDFDQPVTGAVVHPDGSGVLVGKDFSGREDFQLYWLPLDDDSEPQLLTGGPPRHSGALWRRDGQAYAYVGTDGDGGSRLYIGRLDEPLGRLLGERDGRWFLLDWSPDGEDLLAARYRSVAELELWLIDARSGDARRLDPHDEPVSYGAAGFSADGTQVFFTSDHASNVLQLRSIGVDGGPAVPLTPPLPWDVENLAVSPDGRYLAYTLNVDGYSRLRLHPLTGGRDGLPPIPDGVIDDLAFDFAGRRLGFTLSNPQTPSDVFAFALGDLELTRWTRAPTPGLDPSDFAMPTLEHVASFDGLQVPMWVYRPDGPGPHPVLIDIHGGPEAQARPSFNALREYLRAELGVAVVVPNVRGSYGYGKRYLALDDGRLRENAVRDIGAVLDWIGRRRELDASRVAVYGESYGGYLALASLVRYGDRLAGGIEIAGISRFVSYLERTGDDRRALRRAEYGDERDPEMRRYLDAISPLTHAERIDTPLFVVQGVQDPRVSVDESQRIVDSVRANDGEVWFLLAGDEGHGFRRQHNNDVLINAMVLWLERHLLTPQRHTADATEP